MLLLLMMSRCPSSVPSLSYPTSIYGLYPLLFSRARNINAECMAFPLMSVGNVLLLVCISMRTLLVSFYIVKVVKK